MNEMRKLMEILQYIEDDKDEFVNALKGNQKIVLAYSDDDSPRGTRDLDIRGIPTSLGTWHRIMTRSLAHTDGGYNDFEVDSIAAAFRDAMHELSIGETELQFIPGRENSVVLYVTGPYDLLKELGNYIHNNGELFKNVNELNTYEDGGRHFSFPVLRLWWD